MPEPGKRDEAGGWRHPGWAWTTRHDRLVPAGYWVAGLLVAFALGNVPSLVTADWKLGTTWVSLWLSVGAALLALAVFGFAETARRFRSRMIAQNGTAYLIQELARFWTPDKAARFRTGIQRQFARVIQVPGPAEASPGWDWSLDGDTRQWDARADELVRAFRVLRIDETRNGPAGPVGLFLWAYGAVATAFGMRVTAADRDLVLDVWQRPSRARAGDVDPEIWSQRPQRFTAAVAPGSSGLTFTEHAWDADLDVTWPGGPPDGAEAPARAEAKVSVLLLRFGESPWGPLPSVADPQPEGRVVVPLRAADGILPCGTVPAEVHELRCVPPRTPAGPQFPAEQFPALAATAATWVEGKARKLDGHTLLIGTQLPQEVSLGLGILAGQESRRATWPVHLRPIVAEPVSYTLVIPWLDLGTAALDPTRAEGA